MTTMEKTVGSASMFDAQSASTGPAGPVKYYATDGSGELVVPGTSVKLLPIPECARGEFDGSEEYRSFISARAEWVYDAVKAGGRTTDCWKMLVDAGHNVTLQTIYAQQERYRKSGALGTPAPVVALQTASSKQEEAPDIDLEEVSSAGRAHAETIAGISALIDASAERMELELRIEIEELKPKALKWEQLRKIRDLLPK